MKRKGIILAGGNGTRLYPLTQVISKQLLPVYDKPMIYYPLSTLMLAGIRQILIITMPHELERFKNLLGNGAQFGIELEYITQAEPNGIAQALNLGKNFLAGSPCALILGDNLFYGHALSELLIKANARAAGATIFACYVKNPQAYGVVNFDHQQKPIGIEEKPIKPRSNYAVSGLYFYDSIAVDYVQSLKPSGRGELEITDLNLCYLQANALQVELLGRGFAWFDMGTHASLLDAGHFVATLENRQGLKVACLEEIALRFGWINNCHIQQVLSQSFDNGYSEYLSTLIQKIPHETCSA